MTTRKRQGSRRLRNKTRKGGAVTNVNKKLVINGLNAFGNAFKGKVGERPWNMSNTTAKNKAKKNFRNTLTKYLKKYLINPVNALEPGAKAPTMINMNINSMV